MAVTRPPEAYRLFYEVIAMDINEIVSLISTVGFPICCCCAIFVLLKREQENHKSEVNDLKGVISEINSTLAALKQLIQDKL